MQITPGPAARLVALAAATLLLAGCATRAERVEAALVQAGISSRMAACLAPRLTERLTDDQLRSLAEAARRPTADGARASTTDIIARVAATGDPQIVDVLSRAGLHCALRG